MEDDREMRVDEALVPENGDRREFSIWDCRRDRS